ncbi:unnamed protein product [Amoebophrya sp. A120]|nr:unnamed protein product [Amoebophrya sp. A120]|eukprot:GSA120T00004410001.1
MGDGKKKRKEDDSSSDEDGSQSDNENESRADVEKNKSDENGEEKSSKKSKKDKKVKKKDKKTKKKDKKSRKHKQRQKGSDDDSSDNSDSDAKANNSSDDNDSSSSEDKKKKKKKKKKKAKKEHQEKPKHHHDDALMELVAPKKIEKLVRAAATYYLDVPNMKRLLHYLLTNGQEELEDQGYEKETPKILDRIVSDLKSLFTAIDDGQSVSLDGLTNPAKKKKLRHLFQGLKMTQGNDEPGMQTHQGANRTKGGWERHLIAETYMYWDHLVGPCVGEIAVGLRKQYKEKEEKKREELKKIVKSPRSSPTNANPPPGQALLLSAASSTGSAVAGDGQLQEHEHDTAAQAEQNATASSAAAKASGIGPARPPSDMVISRKKPKEDNKNEPDQPAWLAGADMSDALAGLFGGSRQEKKDAFEIERTQGELDAFEKAYSGQQKSLFDQVRDGTSGADSLKRGRELAEKRMKGDGDLWGAGKHEQEMINAREGEVVVKTRKLFDPTTDLDTKKQIDAKTFSKMMEGDGALKGKFGRSQISSSFL